MTTKHTEQGSRAEFQVAFDKLGHQWSESNQEKAFLGWLLAKYASPSPAPAVPDAAKPETQGEQAEMAAALSQLADTLDQVPISNETLKTVLRQAAALLAAGPAHVEPENRCIRELREYAAKNQGAWIFPGWDGNRITKYLTAHGIGKDQAS